MPNNDYCLTATRAVALRILRLRAGSFVLPLDRLAAGLLAIVLCVLTAGPAAAAWSIGNFMGNVSGVSPGPYPSPEAACIAAAASPNYPRQFDRLTPFNPFRGTHTCLTPDGSGYAEIGYGRDCDPAFPVDRNSGVCNCATRGLYFLTTTQSCVNPVMQYAFGASLPKMLGRECPTCGNPITIGTYNKFQQETDYAAPGTSPLRFVRSYNSMGGRSVSMGVWWMHNYERTLVPFGEAYQAFRPDGKIILHRKAGAGWLPDADIRDRLEAVSDPVRGPQGFRLRVHEDDSVEEYDAGGRLIAIIAREGTRQEVRYVGQADPLTVTPARVESVRDSFGRELRFQYNAEGRLARFIDPEGGVHEYAYAADGSLVEARAPDGTARRYQYGEPAQTAGTVQPYALTGVSDENGVRVATFSYQRYGRPVSTERAGGTNRYVIDHNNPSDISHPPVTKTVTDPLGAVRRYTLANVVGAYRVTAIGGDACPSCGPAAQAYDANGNVVSRTDWNGNVTAYAYDLARNLETSRTEASGTPQARTITTDWHPTFRLPVRVTEPGRVTDMAYDARGNMTSRTVTDTASGRTRTWTWTHTYSSVVPGMLERTVADGPRSDVSDTTTTDYWPADAACPGTSPTGCRGQLQRVTNALGHVTEVGEYNAHGQPTRITDPNGLVTVLAYDARQRLISRTVGTETTAYEYDPVGSLVKTTFPDASFLAYDYDDAHRLVSVADSLGNRIDYTLDAMGNRTREEVRDPAGALAQARTREYSNLNRLAREIGAAGQVTRYAYDPQGNLTGITDPLNKTTTQTFDALNRLATQTDPAAGLTRYAYNPLDQLTGLTDPRNLTTSYALNALDELARETSPDSGITDRTHDAAGNVLTRTDARGQSATYTYDAFNRVTRIQWSDQVHTFSYDAGANGIGRLTGYTDPSGSTSLGYDVQGRVTAETRTIAGRPYTTAYAYDAAGRLASVTYPTGRVIRMSRDAAGRVSQIESQAGGQVQVLAANVQYHPTPVAGGGEGGLVRQFLFGNATGYVRSIDADGRVSAHTFGPGQRSLTFDPASRITALADTSPAQLQTFGYDALDRLSGWATPSTTQGYAYDATGNRTSLTVGANVYAYGVDAASNRLLSTAGPGGAKTFTHDAMGNIVAAGTTSFGYDARGRMRTAMGVLGTTTYSLNALGERVSKTTGTDGRHFHYDRAGRLIAETDASGNALKEYVWLADQPIAVFDTTRTSGGACSPENPTLVNPASFSAFNALERLEVRGGRPGARDWEWGLGPNTQAAGQFASAYLDWVSGRQYTYVLAYDGAGNATVTVSFEGAVLFTRSWSGGMDAGNALKFYVKANADVGAGNGVAVSIGTINGRPVNRTIQASGSNQFVEEVAVYQTASGAFTVEGTVSISYAGSAPPAGSRLNFIVTAGNVPCEGTEASTTLYYVHADHLNTPRALVDQQNRVVWRWDSDPFGVAAPAEDPDGDGKNVAFDLRFPGQYFDRETNLHYNYFRDYDPQTGRYVQSDPIGLAGGINPYGYANQNPLSYTDPRGLQVAGAVPAPIPAPPTPTPGPGVGRPPSSGDVIPFPGGRNRPSERPGRWAGQEETDFCPQPERDCERSYQELMREFNWIVQFEGVNENPYDPVQALIIRSRKIDYNRHAMNHNRRCPSLHHQVPLFLVDVPRFIK